MRPIDADLLARELQRTYLEKDLDEIGEDVYKTVASIYSMILCMPTLRFDKLTPEQLEQLEYE